MKGVGWSNCSKIIFTAGIFVLVTAVGSMAREGKRQGEAPEFLLAIYHQARNEAAAQKVEVKESEWRIEPAKLILSPGNTVFQVTNVGTYPHVFSIGGQGIHLSERANRPWKNSVPGA